MKKINEVGNYFVEDIIDRNGMKLSRIMFDNNCKLVSNANEYLWYLEMSSTNSYNSIKIYSNDLCYFYNFLKYENVEILKLNANYINKFILFLKKIRIKNYSNNFKRKVNYSIENALANQIEFIGEKKRGTNIISLGRSEGLDDNSITRIYKNTIKYLKFLNIEKGIKFNKDIEILIKSNRTNGYLKAAGIYKNILKVNNKIEECQLISDTEYNLIFQKSKQVYSKLLFYLLRNTGMRIGEILGLNIEDYEIKDLRKSLRGDVFFENNRWRINIIYRSDNAYDKLAKSHSDRSIYLKKSEIFIFEALLERYLKARKKILRNKKEKQLFISSRGTALTQNTAYKALKKVLEATNIQHRSKDITLHSFRHTFITEEIKSGVPIIYVSKYVGHRNLDTTIGQYLHLTNKDIVEIREKYDEYMEKHIGIKTIDLEVK